MSRPRRIISRPSKTIRFRKSDDNINKIRIRWANAIFPEHVEEAEVVTIYKKGNPTDFENYKPISLLQILYKIYASIIQKRLAKSREPHLTKCQFGFRAIKSTQQPLLITRRVQEKARQNGEIDNSTVRLETSV